MRKILFIIFVFLSLFNCKSQQIDIKIKAEAKILMTKIFDDFVNTPYFRDKNISINILYNPSIIRYNSWKQLILKSQHVLPNAKSYNIKTKEYKTDYYKIFTEKEINYMSEQITDINSKTWRNYIGISLKRRPFKKQNNPRLNQIGIKTYYYTLPVFTINNDYALIYVENTYGGDIKIYQKIKGKWQIVSNVGIWVS